VVDLAVSAEPVVAVDAQLRVLSWNAQVEELTGVPASGALGRRCWLVLRGESPPGSIFCHTDCTVISHAQGAARAGRPPPS
jgi:PAS domain-containing protein